MKSIIKLTLFIFTGFFSIASFSQTCNPAVQVCDVPVRTEDLICAIHKYRTESHQYKEIWKICNVSTGQQVSRKKLGVCNNDRIDGRVSCRDICVVNNQTPSPEMINCADMPYHLAPGSTSHGQDFTVE